MEKEEAGKRIEKLKKLINRHRYLYHVLDRQEISQEALDSLKKELFDLEQKFPEFITLDSPTQRIGGSPLEKFEKIRHSRPMLSFNDAFSMEDMENWMERNLNYLKSSGNNNFEFFCELKMDGLAIEVSYEQGFFKEGSTRGDGIIGENVSENLKTIEAIPLSLAEISEAAERIAKAGRKNLSNRFLEKAKLRWTVTVRGEAIMPKKEFERINKGQQKKGLSLYANPRNTVAGSIRQLDAKITAGRKLDFFAYDLIEDLGQETHQEKHAVLAALGFKVGKYDRICSNLGEVEKFHEFCLSLREKMEYEIDGIVVIANEIPLFEKLGAVGKSPRGAIAFKFPLAQSTTIVEDIMVNVGRTGVLTPVAKLKPVPIGGVTVSRATLHNEDEIKRLGVKIGDTVVVGRAGDVIPAILKVLPELRSGKEKDFKMPSECPVCGSKVIRRENEAAYRCQNPECFAVEREFFYHFVSRPAFNIDGLGPKIINRLVEEGLCQDPADIFTLKEGDMEHLERFGEKSASNLVKAIQEKRKISFARLVYALGIRNVGEQTALDLSEKFGSLEELAEASHEELASAKDIGPVTAESISRWFQNKKRKEFSRKLLSRVEIEYPKKREKGPFAGKIFVLTGQLEFMPREEAKEKIIAFGGKFSESVSAKTHFLIKGDNPGSKLEKARRLKIAILEEKDFLKMIGK